MSKLKDENVATINESGLGSWPYGSRPYLYGAWWWNQAQQEKGESIIEIWNQNYSRRLPFLLNGPVVEQTGKTVDQFLRHTLTKIEGEGQSQIEQIKRSGEHQATNIAEPNGEQSAFALSPDGKRLVYWLARPQRGSEARLKQRSSPDQAFSEIASERLFKSVGSVRVRWIDNRRFVFDQIDIYNPHTTFRDLFIYDVDSRQTERLTTAHAPKKLRLLPMVSGSPLSKTRAARIVCLCSILRTKRSELSSTAIFRSA